MSQSRRNLKIAAAEILEDSELSNKTHWIQENVYKGYNFDIVFPFISSPIEWRNYFGDKAYNVFERPSKTADYKLQRYESKTNMYKAFRKKLRPRLAQHLQVDSILPFNCASLVMDFFLNTVECFSNETESLDMEPQPLIEECQKSGNDRRYRVHSIQMQCVDSECQLLRVLESCKASVVKVCCLDNVTSVATDFPFEVKKGDRVYRFTTAVDLNCDLSVRSWCYTSYFPTVTHLIQSRPNDEGNLACDVSFRTHVEETLQADNTNSHGNASPIDPTDVYQLLQIEDALSLSGSNQLKAVPQSWINSVSIRTQRRRYSLEMDGISLCLNVYDERYYRVDKQTGKLIMTKSGTCIPTISFPLREPLDKSKITVCAARIAGCFLVSSGNPSLLRVCTVPCFIRFPNSKEISCTDFQLLRRLAYADDSIYAMFGLSKSASDSEVVEQMFKVQALISSHASALEMLPNDKLKPSYLHNRLNSVKRVERIWNAS